MQQKPLIPRSELLSLPDVYFLLNHELPYDSDAVIEYLEEKGIAWLREQRILLHYLQTDADYKASLDEQAEPGSFENIIAFLSKHKGELVLDDEFREFFQRSGHSSSVTIGDVYVELLEKNPTFIVDLAKARKNYASQIQKTLQGDNQRFLFGIFERFAEHNQDADIKKAAFQNLLMVQQFATPFCRVFRSTTGDFQPQDVAALSLSEVSFILRYAPNQSFLKASNLLLAVAQDSNLQDDLSKITDTLTLSELEPSLEEAIEYFAGSFKGIECHEILDVFSIFFSDQDEMRVSGIRALIQTESILLSKMKPNSKLPELLEMLAREETINKFADHEKLGMLNLAASHSKNNRVLVRLFNIALKDRDYLMLSIILNAAGIRLYAGFDKENIDLPRELTALRNFKELCQAIIHADSVEFLNPIIRVLQSNLSPEAYFSSLWAICEYAEKCHSEQILKKLERILTPLVQSEFIEKNRKQDFLELVRLNSFDSLESVMISSKAPLSREAKRLLDNKEYFYTSCADAASSKEPIADLLDILRAMYDGGKLEKARMRETFTGKLHQIIPNFHRIMLIHDLFDKSSTAFGACHSVTDKFVEYHMSSYEGLQPVSNLKKLKIIVAPEIGRSHYQIIFRFLILGNSETANQLALKLTKALKAVILDEKEGNPIEVSFFWLALSQGRYEVANLIKASFNVSIKNSFEQVRPKTDSEKVNQLFQLCLKNRFCLSPENYEDKEPMSLFLYAGVLVLKREQRLNICGTHYNELISSVLKVFEEGEKSFQVLSGNIKIDWRTLTKKLIHSEDMSQKSQDILETFFGAISLGNNKKQLFTNYFDSVSSSLDPSSSSLSKLVLMTSHQFRDEFSVAAKTALCTKASIGFCQSNKFSSVMGAFIPSEIVKQILVMTFSTPIGKFGDFVARNLSSIFREQLKPVIENTLEDDTQSFISL